MLPKPASLCVTSFLSVFLDLDLDCSLVVIDYELTLRPACKRTIDCSYLDLGPILASPMSTCAWPGQNATTMAHR